METHQIQGRGQKWGFASWFCSFLTFASRSGEGTCPLASGPHLLAARVSENYLVPLPGPGAAEAPRSVHWVGNPWPRAEGPGGQPQALRVGMQEIGLWAWVGPKVLQRRTVASGGNPCHSVLFD